MVDSINGIKISYHLFRYVLYLSKLVYLFSLYKKKNNLKKKMLKIQYISVVIYFNLYPIHYNKVNFKNLVLAYIDLDMI